MAAEKVGLLLLSREQGHVEEDEEEEEEEEETDELNVSSKMKINQHGTEMIKKEVEIKEEEAEIKIKEEETEQEVGKEPNSNLLDASSESPREKHISIQRTLADLEKLADLKEDGIISAVSQNTDPHVAGDKKPCPLCPEDQFKACYGHKLHRHLQNLHWKVSVEFEGYRMCICYLPCHPVKPNVAGDQISLKMGAHYHCIICSATITRRTDMVGHVKRHVNKGETESRYSSAQAPKSAPDILKEADTDIQVLPNYSTPQKTDSYFNPKMKLNRQLIVCALAVLAEERKPLECLDAFGATGSILF